VAILYSPPGWFTYHGVYELLRDPEVVHLVRTRAQAPEDQSSYYTEKIIEYCNTTYGDENYYGGADKLDIEWIELGDKFRFSRHDGIESIEYLTQTTWLEA